MRILFFLVVAGLIVWMIASLRRPTKSAYDRLMDLALHDRERVERLIAAEIKRQPGITREEAARDALRRWQRDLH